MMYTDIGNVPDPVERFFAYAQEREAIRIRREELRQPRPWTSDPILQKYRFCNVHREDDATTRWFKASVREPIRNDPEVFFATVLFRWFNRISTGEAIFMQTAIYLDGFSTAWEQFLRTGETSVLRHAIQLYCGAGPYITGSYIVHSPSGVDKLTGLLQYFDRFMRNGWRDKLSFFYSLENAWEVIRRGVGFGDFTAYEVVTDLRYTFLLEGAPDIMTWANPGPGARRGLDLIYRPVGGGHVDRESMIEEMRRLLKISKMLPKKIEGVRTSSWEMREVEHTLCEFDKYERTRLGQGRPRGRLL